MKIAVLGTTGRTGRHVLEEGIRRGHLITAFSRRPEGVANMQGLQAVLQGDGRNPSHVLDAVRGQDAVISILSSPGFGPSATVSSVTRNIIAAMRETGVRRFVTVSSHSLVATRQWLTVTLVKWIFRNPYTDLAAMEQAVFESNLDWTIVRATQLTDGRATGRVRRTHGDFDAGPYTISRADLASVLVDVVESAEDARIAMEVSGS